MSNVAKGLDGNIHYADDVLDSYHGEYFCLNEKCGVKMILKNLDLRKSGLPSYIRISRPHPHSRI